MTPRGPERTGPRRRVSRGTTASRTAFADPGVGFVNINVAGLDAVKHAGLSVVADGVSTPQDIDQMWMINFGMSWGPFQLMDKVGLDVVRDIELHYMDERPGLPTNTIELLDEYIARGDLGKKSGKGFYDYSQES